MERLFNIGDLVFVAPQEDSIWCEMRGSILKAFASTVYRVIDFPEAGRCIRINNEYIYRYTLAPLSEQEYYYFENIKKNKNILDYSTYKKYNDGIIGFCFTETMLYPISYMISSSDDYEEFLMKTANETSKSI